MKIFGMMLVKNEADIIAQCITDALVWVDKIFVIDNGSTDGSWEILQSMKSSSVVPWKQDFTPYRRTMRAEIFNNFRHLAGDGDWWYFADADEFYVDNPKEFLSGVPARYHVVFKKSIDYFITKEDIKEYQFTGSFDKDRENIRYIEPECWAEVRFFRYRKRLRWPVTEEKPLHMGRWYPVPITVRHYQYRSPSQMQARIDIRNSIPKDKEGRPFKHVSEKNWRELLRSRSELIEDPGISGYNKLPLRRDIREKPLNRIVKAVLHGTGMLP